MYIEQKEEQQSLMNRETHQPLITKSRLLAVSLGINLLFVVFVVYLCLLTTTASPIKKSADMHLIGDEVRKTYSAGQHHMWGDNAHASYTQFWRKKCGIKEKFCSKTNECAIDFKECMFTQCWNEHYKTNSEICVVSASNCEEYCNA